MLVFIGIFIILISVFGGFALGGGHLYALIQPVEFIIIGGAALGSFIISNNTKVIKAVIKGAFSTLKPYPYTNRFNVELLSLFYELNNKLRKEGPMSIEADVENYTESPFFTRYPLVLKDHKVMEFLTDNLRLIITGRVDVMHLETIMDIDIETYDNEAELPILAINKVADSMPAFGIVAAVMGVVHTMESIGVPPAQLGGLVAKALVGTFLGVLIGYGFIAPVGTSMDTKRLATIKIMHSIKIALMASAHNFAPTIAVEMARKVLYSDSRPNSKELEDIVKEIKANKAGEAKEAAHV